MKKHKTTPLLHRRLHLALGILLASLVVHRSSAFETYSGCKACHGDFRGPTSTKGTVFPNNNNHDMHRNSANMATDCNLCHSGSSRLPVLIGSSTGTASNPGLGCVGCHVAEGLRAHHAANGVAECLECHDTDGPSPPENVKPPYYGTADTKVNNPGNTILAANTNENWSIGDFLGVDNDGNNLYDLADYAIGPLQLVSLTSEGSNMRITWLTAGGRTNRLQAATAISGAFIDLGLPLAIPGVGLVTTNYLEIGGATNLARFYRVTGAVP